MRRSPERKSTATGSGGPTSSHPSRRRHAASPTRGLPPPQTPDARRRARLRPGLGLQASQGHSGPRRPLGRSSPRLTHRTTRHRTPDGMPEPCPVSELRLSHPGPQAPRHHGPKGESLGTSLAFAQTICHHDLNPERWPGSEGQRGSAGALAPPGGHALEQHVSALPLLPTRGACSALARGPCQQEGLPPPPRSSRTSTTGGAGTLSLSARNLTPLHSIPHTPGQQPPHS